MEITAWQVGGANVMAKRLGETLHHLDTIRARINGAVDAGVGILTAPLAPTFPRSSMRLAATPDHRRKAL